MNLKKVVCSNNMIAEIIEYRNYKDIDVKYEDGYIYAYVYALIVSRYMVQCK